MLAVIARRMADAGAVLLLVSAAVFVALHLSGDPVPMMLDPSAPASEHAALRHELGLDRPLHRQYLALVRGAVRGDLGRSFRYGEPAVSIVLGRVPATLQLAVAVLLCSGLAAIAAALVSATQRNGWVDHGVRALTAVVPSIPAFWLGVMLIYLLSVRWAWLPTSGRGSWAHLIMPTICLGLMPFARLTRLLRSSLLTVLDASFVTAARARGLSRRRVLLVHALRNAAGPFVAELSTQAGLLLGGAAVVETVFAWPGIGQLIVQSIGSRDYPVVQAVVLMSAVVFVSVNLASDLVHAWLDPLLRDV